MHESTLCTLTRRGEGTCNGDSGGPLVLGDELVGLVNWGFGCASGKPDGKLKSSFIVLMFILNIFVIF